MSATAESLASHVSAQAAAAGGTLGLGSFLRAIVDGLKAAAITTIDTEEERDAIKDRLLAVADVVVAPRFGPLWGITRTTVDWTLDEYMDKLPALLSP